MVCSPAYQGAEGQREKGVGARIIDFELILRDIPEVMSFELKEVIAMPFINSMISVKITEEQERELKSRLGQAISVIPGKSESWLMTGFQDEYHLYFRGNNSEPVCFVEVSVYGGENAAAFSRLTAEITKIYGDVLGIKADHIYVKYETTQNWGWNGSNF